MFMTNRMQLQFVVIYLLQYSRHPATGRGEISAVNGASLMKEIISVPVLPSFIKNRGERPWLEFRLGIGSPY
jgi:hypothetical protein